MILEGMCVEKDVKSTFDYFFHICLLCVCGSSDPIYPTAGDQGRIAGGL